MIVKIRESLILSSNSKRRHRATDSENINF